MLLNNYQTTIPSGREPGSVTQRASTSLPFTATIDYSGMAILSHELLSPLGTIQSYISTLKGALGPISHEQEQQYILGIERISRRLARLVQNSLECYRVGQSICSDLPHIISLPSLIKSITLEMKCEAPLHTLKAKVPRIMPKFYLDEKRVSLVLTNLIGNAVKYSPNGGVIEVTLEYVHKLDGLSGCSLKHSTRLPHLPFALIKVQDEGVGIPEEEVERIFEPFHRLQNDSPFVLGMGIGLYICKAIVEDYGGSIWAESRLEKGSTFLFTIPGYRIDSHPKAITN